jgi:hypothetical protein
MNKKVSIWVESGAVDDIEYAKPKTRSGRINRARQPIHIARLSGGLISGNDTYRSGFTDIDELKAAGAVGYEGVSTDPATRGRVGLLTSMA